MLNSSTLIKYYDHFKVISEMEAIEMLLHFRASIEAIQSEAKYENRKLRRDEKARLRELEMLTQMLIDVHSRI